LLLAVPFVVRTPDERPVPARPARTSWRINLRRNPDFAWAWGTRFLIQLGNALGTLYLLYFLTDRVRLAALLLAIWPTWPVALVASVLLGAGYGVYLAVDTALVTQVLPAATDRAKDLGIINIATAAPQVLGPALAAPLVTHLGGYPTLYAVTAAVTLLGAVLVLRIRSVR
jgi:MFS family permease